MPKNKKLILLLLAVFAVGGATKLYAIPKVDMLGDQYKLNQASPQAMAEAKLGDKVVQEKVHILRAVYDYSVLGGRSTSALSLRDISTGQPAVIPKGAILRNCIVDVVTPPAATTGSSISIGASTSRANLRAVKPHSAYVAGQHPCLVDGTFNTFIKIPTDQSVSASIGVYELTAGKFFVILEYVLSDTQ